MPSHLIHLVNARRFLSVSNIIKNESQFLLGAISPDSITDKKTHIKSEIPQKINIHYDYFDEWEQGIIDFYLDHKNFLDPDFLLGYVFHLYGDWTFEKKYNDDLLNALKKPFTKSLSTSTEQLLTQEYYAEFLGYDNLLFKSDYYNKQVLPIFTKSIPREILGIKENDIELLKNYILTTYKTDCENYKPQYFTDEIIEDYFLWTIAFFKNGL